MCEHGGAHIVEHMLTHARHDAHAPIVESQLDDGNQQVHQHNIPQGNRVFGVYTFVDGKFDEVWSRDRSGCDDDHQRECKEHLTVIRFDKLHQALCDLGVVPLIQLFFGLGDKCGRNDLCSHGVIPNSTGLR